MKELCAFEAVIIISFRAAVELGFRWRYAGTTYDPRDFSYWGA